MSRLSRFAARIIAALAFSAGSLVCATTANAALLNFSAQLGGIDREFEGQHYVWNGGQISGQLTVSDTPFSTVFNPNNQETVSRFSFSGAITLDGTPIVVLPSYFAVFHNPNALPFDSVQLNLNFTPLSVTPDLVLLNLVSQLDFTSELPFLTFPVLAGLVPQEKSAFYNLSPTQRLDVTFVVTDHAVTINDVPEPSTIALIGMALLSIFSFGLVRNQRKVY